MQTNPSDYSLLFKFIDTYSKTGFNEIDRKDTLMLELEEMMEVKNQFFYVADLIQMKILFTSRRSSQMIGIDPEELSFIILWRLRTLMIFSDLIWEGLKYLSLDRICILPKKELDYYQLILRCGIALEIIPIYIFRAMYILQQYLIKQSSFFKLHTNVDWYQKKKNFFPYYLGDDLRNFRYPDEQLLTMGSPLSDREFEIIRMAAEGFSSEEIAEKLFLRVNTIHTHRTNILNKTGKDNFYDLIYSYKDRGLM